MTKFFENHGSCGIPDEPNHSNEVGLALDLQLPVIGDEVSVSIQSPFLGIGLQELRYKNNYRVVVSNIKENAASEVQQKLRERIILTEVNQLDVEGYNLDQVAKALKSDTRPIHLTFRDPDVLLKCLVANDPGIYRTAMVPAVLSPSHHRQFLYVANYPQQLGSERQAAAMGSVLEVRLRSQMISAAQAEEVLAKESVQQRETGDEGQLEIKDAGTVVYFVLGADKPSGKFITFSDSAEGDKSAAAPAVTEILGRVWQDWDRLLVGMRPGDRRVVVLPASMMDKTTASTSIDEGDKMLALDVRLLSIDGDIDQ
eukprot:gene24350-29433_t